MDFLNTLAFLVFPYIALTIFVLGHGYRYVTDLYGWNVNSGQFLDRTGHRAGITLFHWGILLTLLGHAGGLLIPQRYYDMVGIDGQAHTMMAVYVGMVVGLAAVAGLVVLICRRIFLKRPRATTSANHLATLSMLLFVSAVGLYNVFFGHFYVLDTVAPWIRSILIFNPRPELMIPVPIGYKIHILSALVLLAWSPFTRLVHIWSVPVSYLTRSPVLFKAGRELS